MSSALVPAGGACLPDSEIFLMVAVDRSSVDPSVDAAPLPAAYETFHMFPGESVRDVKLRLQAKNGHYTRGQMVIFGDRELGEHELLGPLAEKAAVSASSSSAASASSGGGGSDYLHLFVRIEDIEGVDVQTSHRSLSTGKANNSGSSTPGGPVRTNATDALPMRFEALPPPPSSSSSPPSSPPSRSSSGGTNSSDSSSSALALADWNSVAPTRPTGPDYVHLMVRRTANRKLQYVVQGKVFELTISATASTEEVTQQIVDASCWGGSYWASSEPHALVYDGLYLESSAPLASHGLAPGARLEVVPLSSAAMGRLGRRLPLPSVPEAPLKQLSYDDEQQQQQQQQLPEEEEEDEALLTLSPDSLFNGWQDAKAWLESGHMPSLASAGSGGSYMLQDESGRTVAVFKPEDEEPNARNNPRGWVGEPTGSPEGLRRGVLPGEGAAREVAAYLLDHGGFSGVPPTAMVSFLEHRDGAAAASELKRGSLQQFVNHDTDCEERGPGSFSVDEVHRIMILDMRLSNTDRNGSNILARLDRASGSWELTPIDHGYCLPSSLQDVSFEWMYWPQADAPFSDDALAYIKALDAEADIRLLASHGLYFRPECLRILRVCTALLKKGAAAGLTPGAIARLMAREFLTMSPLEKLHKRAVRVASHALGAAHNASRASAAELDEDIYLVEMHQGMDELLDEIALDDVQLY